jgi:hypothetical protein
VKSQKRKVLVRIRTILQCWLCRKSFDLILNVFDGTSLGNPRYWCRHCTSQPQIFARLLRARMAELEAVYFVPGGILATTDEQPAGTASR